MVVLGPLSTKVQVTSVVPLFLDKGLVFWHGTQDLSQSVSNFCNFISGDLPSHSIERL